MKWKIQRHATDFPLIGTYGLSKLDSKIAKQPSYRKEERENWSFKNAAYFQQKRCIRKQIIKRALTVINVVESSA